MKTLLFLCTVLLALILLVLGMIYWEGAYGGTYDLIYTYLGNDYVMDTNLSYDDCIFRTASDNFRCLKS